MYGGFRYHHSGLSGGLAPAAGAWVRRALAVRHHQRTMLAARQTTFLFSQRVPQIQPHDPALKVSHLSHPRPFVLSAAVPQIQSVCRTNLLTNVLNNS